MSARCTCFRIAATLLLFGIIGEKLPSQGVANWLWEESFEGYLGDLAQLFEARRPESNKPADKARAWRIQVALHREPYSIPSGLWQLGWKDANERMKVMRSRPPQGLIHHGSSRIFSGQTAVFGDLKSKSFLVDTNVEGGNSCDGNSPVVRVLKQGYSLCLRPEPAAEGLPRRLTLDLAWQRFPDKVEPMVVGMDQLHSLDQFRSDFARIQAGLALGKQRAWVYRPGGTGFAEHTLLILLEELPSAQTKVPPAPSSASHRPTWVARFGKDHWTTQGKWAPVASPHVIPTLEEVPASIEDASAQSYLADLNIEVGLKRIIVDPEINMLPSGLGTVLTVQTLGDRLWVGLTFRDQRLTAMRDVTLDGTLHGILRAPTTRSRSFSRHFLLAPGERFPLGSGPPHLVDGKPHRTRLWLRIDKLGPPGKPANPR